MSRSPGLTRQEKDLRKNSTKSEFNCHLPPEVSFVTHLHPGWTGPSSPHDPGPLSVRAQSGVVLPKLNAIPYLAGTLSPPTSLQGPVQSSHQRLQPAPLRSSAVPSSFSCSGRVVGCQVCRLACSVRQRSRKRAVAIPRPCAICSAALGTLSCLPLTSVNIADGAKLFEVCKQILASISPAEGLDSLPLQPLRKATLAQPIPT